MMTLNIPGNSKAPVVLTSSMLKYEAIGASLTMLSEYPFFTPDVRYPKELLKRYSYAEVIEFFFNRTKFETVLMNSTQDNTCVSPNIDQSEFDDTYENMEIENCNVEIMIEMLFPTVFPSVNNNISSFAQYIMAHKQDIITFKGSIPSVLSGFVANLAPSYSYLNIGGKTYTVTKTIWLNDFVNNPVYKSFIDSYIIFELWRKTVGETLKRERMASDNDIRKILNEPSIDTILNNERIFNGLSDKNDNINRITIRNLNTDRQLVSLKYEIRKLFGYAEDGNESSGFRLEFETETARNNALLEKEKNGAQDELNDDELDAESNATVVMKIDTTSVVNSVNDINTNIGIISASIPGFKLNGSLLAKITRLTKIVDAINTVDTLQTNYFKDDANPGFNEDDTISSDLKQTKYAKYNAFFDTARNLISPSRESSNRNLQNAIEDYVNNVSPYFNQYMRYIKNRYFMNNTSEQFPRSESYFKSGVTDNPNMPLFVGISRIEIPTPIYEMYIQIDVIGGEVTNDTKHLLGCDYMGDMLGDKLQTIITRRETINNKSNNTSIFKVEPTKFYYDLQPNIDTFMNTPPSTNTFSDITGRIAKTISPSTGGSIENTRRSKCRKRRTRRKKNRRVFKITRRRK